MSKQQIINPLLPGVPFLYPMKTSKNRSFSNVFRGYKKGSGSNGLKETNPWFSRKTQLVITCSKLTIETLAQGVKLVQS